MASHEGKYPKRILEGVKVLTVKRSISNICHLKIVESMRNYIGDEAYNDIRDNSQVGVILKLADKGFTLVGGKYLFHLVANRLSTSMAHEVWVLADGRPIRFSLNEFKHITGLLCDMDDGVDKFVPDEQAWKTLGFGYDGPNGKEIVEKLKKCKEDKNWEQSTKNMLGKLVVLHSAIYGLHPNSRIPLKYAKLVTRPEAFEAHPWGTVSFTALCDSIPVPKANETLSMTLHGLVPALLVWALVFIPHLGRSCGKHVPGEVPLLQWSSRPSRFNEMKLVFEDDKRISGRDKIEVLHLWDVEGGEIFPRWPGYVLDPKVVQMIQDINGKRLDESFWNEPDVITKFKRNGDTKVPIKSKKSRVNDVESDNESTESASEQGHGNRKVALRPDMNSGMELFNQFKSSMELTLSKGLEKIDDRISILETKIDADARDKSELVRIMDQRLRQIEDNQLTHATTFNMIHERLKHGEDERFTQSKINQSVLEQLLILKGLPANYGGDNNSSGSKKLLEPPAAQPLNKSVCGR